LIRRRYDDIVGAYYENYFSKETKKLSYRVQEQRLLVENWLQWMVDYTKTCVKINEVKLSVKAFAVVSALLAIGNIIDSLSE